MGKSEFILHMEGRDYERDFKAEWSHHPIKCKNRNVERISAKVLLLVRHELRKLKYHDQRKKHVGR